MSLLNIVTQKAAEPAYDHSLAFDLFGSDGEVTIGKLGDGENCIGIFADGSWEKVTNLIGTFVVKKDNFKIPYLSEVGTPSFTMKLPKLPYGMLLGISKFFQEVMKRIHDSESMVQIFWDTVTSKYILYVPEQTVSKARIDFVHSLELQADPTKLWVMDCHSHNSMGEYNS